jgi:3-phenylpropionate/trans-cinnamate dioxygenase ferredoxin subunit
MQIVRTPRSPRSETTSASGPDPVDREVELGPVGVLARRRRSVVTADGLELVVIFHRRRFTVAENRCPHLGASLDDAVISRRSLTCSLHGYRYSLSDGAFVSAPRCLAGSNRRLKVFSTRVVDGYLYASVEPALRTEGNP